MSYVGSRVPGSTIRKRFAFTDNTGAVVQLTGSPAVAVYKDAETAESTVGVTLTVDFDGVTGLNLLEIDTTDAFYTAGSDFDAVITSGTADGVSVVGYIPVSFSLATAAIGGGGIDAAALAPSALGAIQNEVGSALTTYGAATSAGLAVIEAKTDNLPSAIIQNQAYNNFPFYMVQASDGRSPATGLGVTATRRIDGGAFAPCANPPVEVGNGVYDVNLAASDLNGQKITFRFTATGALDRIITVHTRPA